MSDTETRRQARKLARMEPDRRAWNLRQLPKAQRRQVARQLLRFGVDDESEGETEKQPAAEKAARRLKKAKTPTKKGRS